MSVLPCGGGPRVEKGRSDMYGTVIWIVLFVVGALLELRARRSTSAVSSLGALGARVSSRVFGRSLLIACWIFVGLHLFARYTLPGH